MKRFFIISLLLLVAACNNTGNTKKANTDPNQLPASLVSNPHTASGLDPAVAEMKPVLEFKDTLHDFGTIHEDEVVVYEFAFTNTGKSPLIISSAQGSCGCTIPDYPHDPVAPGQSGILKVSFNSAAKFGHQEKSVAVHTNSLRGTHMLYIKADVIKKKE